MNQAPPINRRGLSVRAGKSQGRYQASLDSLTGLTNALTTASKVSGILGYGLAGLPLGRCSLTLDSLRLVVMLYPKVL